MQKWSAQLLAIAERLGAKGPHLPPGRTARHRPCHLVRHRQCLNGPVVVAFADTLFRADFTIDPEADGVLFVPSRWTNRQRIWGRRHRRSRGTITDYVEKPSEFMGRRPRHDRHLCIQRRRAPEPFRTPTPHRRKRHQGRRVPTAQMPCAT